MYGLWPSINGASHPGFLGALKSWERSAFSQSVYEEGVALGHAQD
jgi:hypothetical protein